LLVPGLWLAPGKSLAGERLKIGLGVFSRRRRNFAREEAPIDESLVRATSATFLEA
jgi:hypothetical protein